MTYVCNRMIHYDSSIVDINFYGLMLCNIPRAYYKRALMMLL